jgi:hypothetical protein
MCRKSIQYPINQQEAFIITFGDPNIERTSKKSTMQSKNMLYKTLIKG